MGEVKNKLLRSNWGFYIVNQRPKQMPLFGFFGFIATSVLLSTHLNKGCKKVH